MVDRPRSWADRRITSALAAGTLFEVDLLLNAPVSDTLTTVRSVGSLYVAYTISVTVTDSLSIVDLGIGVASREAFVAGGASLPSPAIETEYPPRGWVYVDSKAVWEKTDAAGIQIGVTQFNWDIRSMRKIDKGVLFLSMVNSNVTVGGSMQVVGRVRTLCLA